jgi:YVTN family beta-propeller protein
MHVLRRYPRCPAILADGCRRYVTNPNDDAVSVIDTAAGDVIETLTVVGGSPAAVGLTPDSAHLYLSGQKMAGDPITVGRAPLDVIVTADGTTGYIANLSDNTLSILDIATTDVTTLTNQGAPFDLALGSCPLLPTPTATFTTTPVLTPTPGGGCAGDCDGDGEVSISELIRGVNIALGNDPVSNCPAFDTSGDGEVAISEIIAAVNAALSGC